MIVLWTLDLQGAHTFRDGGKENQLAVPAPNAEQQITLCYCYRYRKQVVGVPRLASVLFAAEAGKKY